MHAEIRPSTLLALCLSSIMDAETRSSTLLA